MNNVIKAPVKIENGNFDPNKKTIFLGGSITGSEDWQEYASEKLAETFNVLNPRRDSFDLTDITQSEIQIDWEFEYLRKADIILFWFQGHTLSPITLFELGGALERNPVIYVGCDDMYYRKFDVTYQCSKFGVKVFDDLKSMIDKILLDFKA